MTINETTLSHVRIKNMMNKNKIQLTAGVLERPSGVGHV